MPETIPRWGLPEVNFLETDAEKIKSEIIKAYETASGRSLASGDPVRLFLLTIAAVIIQLRNQVNWTAQQNLLTYAQGQYLDALGVWVDVERLPASKAVTELKFTLSERLANAFVVPAGFEVSSGDVSFATDKELVIPPGELEGETSASCLVPGVVGNEYIAGQISTIVSPKAFLLSAENITVSEGGSEIENDASYAERIRLRLDSYSVAGPRLAYVYHAKSFSPAISDVSVISPVPGEVDVYTILEDGTLPSESFLEALLENLSSENLRPLTDYVVCKAPEPVNYSIQLDYWINKEDRENAAGIREAVQNAVEEYRVWQQSKIGRDISPSKLITQVSLAGVSRIDEATFEPKAFRELGEDQVAQCSDVKVNFKGYKDI